MIPGAQPFADAGRGATARTAVLCLHGLTSTPQTIRPVATYLADQGYRVNAPRFPGHGTSLRAMSITRYDDWLASSEAALIRLRRDHSDVDRVVVVGLSLGGSLGVDLAARHPDLVDGLGLVNPAFYSSDPRLQWLPVLQHVTATTDGLAGDTVAHDAEEELAYDRLPLKAFASFVQQWPLLLDRAEGIRCPVLLATSARDAVVPPVSSDLLAARIDPNLLHRLPLHDSAHVATLDQESALLNQRIAEFIAAEVDG